jgi:hypothetical protein
MNTKIRTLRLHCFEVRADGSIVKPVRPSDKPETAGIPSSPLMSALVDAPATSLGRTILNVLRGL